MREKNTIKLEDVGGVMLYVKEGTKTDFVVIGPKCTHGWGQQMLPLELIDERREKIEGWKYFQI